MFPPGLAKVELSVHVLNRTLVPWLHKAEGYLSVRLWMDIHLLPAAR